MTAAAVKSPETSVDPFSREFLEEPYARHEALREIGPVFYLSKYEIWGAARYDEVRLALADHETFCSGRGVGLADFSKEEPWRPPSLLLEADPPAHTKMRAIVNAVLNVGALRALRSSWEEKADRIVRNLIDRGEFDAVSDLAGIFPLSVFPDAIGIRENGREHLLPYGALAFNAFGPDNWLRREALAAAKPTIDWVSESCKRENLTQGGFGRKIFDFVDAGEIAESEAERLVRSFLTAGLDTTVNGIANMVVAFAANPEQYQLLRQERELTRHAFEEVLRWDSTVQTFFRTTTKETTLGGVRLPEGAKVLLFLAAANRDPRRWPDPEKFDLKRRPVGHVGFGHGIHVCVGQMVARLEAEILLEAIAEEIEEIELAAPPKRRLNNTLHAWASAPVRVKPAR
ncbi:MAG: cytochrome P450 [Parvularculaceae bacterium]